MTLYDQLHNSATHAQGKDENCPVCNPARFATHINAKADMQSDDIYQEEKPPTFVLTGTDGENSNECTTNDQGKDASASAIDVTKPISCQNCDARYTQDELDRIDDVHERILPGDTMPSGQCPECGAVCFPITPSPIAVMSIWTLVNHWDGDTSVGLYPSEQMAYVALVHDIYPNLEELTPPSDDIKRDVLLALLAGDVTDVAKDAVAEALADDYEDHDVRIEEQDYSFARCSLHTSVGIIS
jgi:hypothetical protein